MLKLCISSIFPFEDIFLPSLIVCVTPREKKAETKIPINKLFLLYLIAEFFLQQISFHAFKISY